MTTWGDAPFADQVAPQTHGRLMHACLEFEEYGADFDPQQAEGVIGLWLSVKH